VHEPPALGSSAIQFDNVTFAFDDHVVLRNSTFQVPAGSMRILLGASGPGNSIILTLIMGLLRPDSGAIVDNGQRDHQMPERELLQLRGGMGMAFQEIALFDSLTVAENVGYRLLQESHMPADEAAARVAEVLGFVGLGEYGERMPSELSGGQRRRVAIARAMASKPDILLFDDPTTGLDPIIASSVDDELVKLRDLEQVTAVMATHQIRDAFYVANHEAVTVNGAIEIRDAATERAQFLVLHDGGIYFEGSGADLLASTDPYLKEFLFMTLPPW
jgi:phospholipid/cholesterol/gamma-HCH transport system ATP-binding protein